MAALRSVSITEAELASAKKALLIDLYEQSCSAASSIEVMAANISYGAKDVLAPAQMTDLFTTLTLADVQVRN